MKYNFKEDVLEDLFDFYNDLSRQPDSIVFDKKQRAAIIASSDDVLWVNIETKEE